MMRLEFEQKANDAAGFVRILNPKSNLLLTPIFQKEYPPEDFLVLMTAPGNKSQCFDKQPYGLNVSKYSVNLLTGGNAFTVISDPQAGGTGAGGNPMGIKEWFDAHEDVRSAFKYAVVYGVGFFLTYAGAVATNGLIDQRYVPFVVIAVGILTEKSKLLDPTKPWPVVGAGKK